VGDTVGGDRADVRRVSGGLPPVPPRPVRVGGAGRADDARTGAAASPLVACRDPRETSRAQAPVPRAPGRVRRFVRRYGWRAYAIPLLTLATLAALVDLVVDDPVVPSSTTGEVTATDDPPRLALRAPGETPASTAPAEGEAGPSLAPQVAGEETYVEQGAGSLAIVDGTSPVHGTGPLQRFVVEIEDGIGVDGVAFAQAVEATLAHPRSWANGGRLSFQRVGAAEASAGQYDFRVSLVSPGSMETYCPGVGTGGYTSCRYGERAVINLARWATAVPHYDGDVATYRLYVVNHEVGHALGNRAHPPCPGPGQLAPVMQQQTLGLNGCARNPWPYP
jgi:hypothetical protein